MVVTSSTVLKMNTLFFIVDIKYHLFLGTGQNNIYFIKDIYHVLYFFPNILVLYTVKLKQCFLFISYSMRNIVSFVKKINFENRNSILRVNILRGDFFSQIFFNDMLIFVRKNQSSMNDLILW